MSDFKGVLGVNKIENEYQFSVWAPNAELVSLVGDFNDWQHSNDVMTQAENGIWWINSSVAKSGDEYKFHIQTANGDVLLKNDPRARKLTNSVGNSVIYDNNFSWASDGFIMPKLHERIIYELHIGTFNVDDGKHGTFSSAIKKLPELVDLGITVIELMPVNEFAGDISWGYNPAYPYAVEEAYGGPDGLKRFIDEAHKLGIAVILDVVYNHFGPSDLDIWQFDGWSNNDKGGIYFYNDYRSATPWGDTRPDYGRIEVQDYIRDNAKMWLEEFRADGLRMDMVPYMRSVSGADNGHDDIAEGYDVIKGINHLMANQFIEKMSIAEDLHHHSFITDSLDAGGCGYSAQWDASFVHPIRKALTEIDDSYINLDAVINALTNCYSQNPYARIVYTESHDEVANGKARVVEEVAPGNVDDDYFARQKGILAASLVLTSAGVPMLFQGQELKVPGWFTDTKGISWSRKKQFQEYFNAFKRLISLRKNVNGNSAGLTGGETRIIHRDDDNKVVGFCRSNGIESEQVYVYINLSNNTFENYKLNGLPNDVECLFSWDDGLNNDYVVIEEKRVYLPGYGVYIFAL